MASVTKGQRYINASAAFGVGVLNTITLILDGSALLRYLAYVVPFFLFAMIFLKLRSTKTLAAIYAVTGWCITLGANAGNFAGIIFLIYATYLMGARWCIVGYLSVNTLIVAGKYGFADLPGHSALTQIFGQAFCFAIYWYMIHPKHKETADKESVVLPIDHKTLDILRHKHEGLAPKQISDKVDLSPNAIYQRLSRARRSFKCANDLELYDLFDNLGLFSQVSDKGYSM